MNSNIAPSVPNLPPLVCQHFRRGKVSTWDVEVVKKSVGNGLLKETHRLKSISSIQLINESSLFGFQMVKDPNYPDQLGVLMHILVPHCCLKTYQLIVVWVPKAKDNEPLEMPKHAVAYPFKAQAMDRFPVVGVNGTSNAENVVMARPNQPCLNAAAHLATKYIQSLLADMSCNTVSIPVKQAGPNTEQTETGPRRTTRKSRQPVAMVFEHFPKERGNINKPKQQPLDSAGTETTVQAAEKTIQAAVQTAVETAVGKQVRETEKRILQSIHGSSPKTNNMQHENDLLRLELKLKEEHHAVMAGKAKETSNEQLDLLKNQQKESSKREDELRKYSLDMMKALLGGGVDRGNSKKRKRDSKARPRDDYDRYESD